MIFQSEVLKFLEKKQAVQYCKVIACKSPKTQSSYCKKHNLAYKAGTVTGDIPIRPRERYALMTQLAFDIKNNVSQNEKTLDEAKTEFYEKAMRLLTEVPEEQTKTVSDGEWAQNIELMTQYEELKNLRAINFEKSRAKRMDTVLRNYRIMPNILDVQLEDKLLTLVLGINLTKEKNGEMGYVDETQFFVLGSHLKASFSKMLKSGRKLGIHIPKNDGANEDCLSQWSKYRVHN